MYDDERQKLPTNIKQIGNISGGFKIYVEDYVYTYIQQYASFAECEEKIGVLTGKKTVFENEDVIFINGVIQGKFSENKTGMEVLSEKSKDYISEQMKIFFPNDEILGWVYIQPGYGDFLNSSLINYHLNNFEKDYNVLFVFDPLEKVNCFFCKNEVTGGLDEVKGYFIYYDRNEGMHEYMLQNKFSKSKVIESEQSESSKLLYSGKDENITDDLPKQQENNDKKLRDATPDIIVNKIRNSFNKERPQKPRTNRRKGKIVTEQKRLVNFLGTLSAVLFCVCFIMGASIIKNDNRIDNVEKQMAAIDNSYTYLVKTVKEGNVQNVFAAQNSNSDFTEKQTESSTALQSGQNVNDKTTTTSTATSEKVTEKITEKTTTSSDGQVSHKTNQLNQTSRLPKKYKVQEGDSLSSISIKFYGTSNKAKKIMEANNIDDPDKIYYGMVISVPWHQKGFIRLLKLI